MKLSAVFKILKGPISIESVRCRTTGFKVEGPFITPALFQLDEEKLRLVESLAIHGGNLKKVAEEMEISYPTLKNRLDEVSAILKQESEELKKKRSEILDMIENGALTPEEGATQLEEL